MKLIKYIKKYFVDLLQINGWIIICSHIRYLKLKILIGKCNGVRWMVVQVVFQYLACTINYMVRDPDVLHSHKLEA